MGDINKKSFSRMVETFVRTHRGCGYIEAVVLLCEKNEIDILDAKKILSKEVVEHIEIEAGKANLLEGGNSSHVLPI